MPKPLPNESKNDFIKRCIPIVIDDGTAKDGTQANAICNSLFDNPERNSMDDKKDNSAHPRKKDKLNISKKKDLKIDIVEIKNVEILSTGLRKGIKIEEKDLDEMITNFNEGVLEPFLNLDHDDKFTDKVKKALSVVSLGFVSQLKRIGNILIADFKQVPKKVAELIGSGMIKQRSVEFFPKGLIVNGKAFNNVLKAVSFFGASIPEVNNLSDDFDILLKSDDYAIAFSDENAEAKIIFTNKYEGVDMEKIEVSKDEYNQLVTFKANNESSIVKLNAENESLTKSNEGLNEKVVTLEKDNLELNTFKKEAVENQKVSLQKEAEKYVNGVIEKGKLLPKFKDDKIADYKAKATESDEKLKLFKDDMDSRDKLLELGEHEAGSSTGGKLDLEKATNDEIDAAVEARMKAEGEEYHVAAAALKVPGFKEDK